jgi:hypothetical protein
LETKSGIAQGFGIFFGQGFQTPDFFMLHDCRSWLVLVVSGLLSVTLAKQLTTNHGPLTEFFILKNSQSSSAPDGNKLAECVLKGYD